MKTNGKCTTTNGNGHATPKFPTYGRSGASLIPVLTGNQVAHSKLTKIQRAVLAAEVLDGRRLYEPTLRQRALLHLRQQPSQRQLAMLFGIGVEYIRTAQTLTPETRAAILAGEYVNFYALQKAQKSRLPHVKRAVMPSDSELARIARHAGAERWLKAGIEAGL
jgi:hypothetical protein